MENSGDNFVLKRIQKIRYIIVKRLISIVAGIIGIVTLIPVIIFVLIMKIIYKERGPIFFCQNRIGKNGKEFKLIKFRSMVVGADKKLKEYLDKSRIPLVLLTIFINSDLLFIKLFFKAISNFLGLPLIKLKIYSSYPLTESVPDFFILPLKISFIILD